MGMTSFQWYKPYKSPEDFFAQKVHSYNDIVRLTNADPERINSLSGAIESFINNERYNTIDTRFINRMIRHDDPRYDKVLESYISHTIDKISSDGVCNDSGHWSLLTQMDKIRSQYNLGKVTEAADVIYNNSLRDMASAIIDANTYLESDEADRIIRKFGSEITMESILNWKSSDLRKQLSITDPNTTNICDMICDNTASYYDLATESFLEEIQDGVTKIAQTAYYDEITSSVIDAIRLIFSSPYSSIDDLVDRLVEYYNDNQFTFPPEAYVVVIGKLINSGIVKKSSTDKDYLISRVRNKLLHSAFESIGDLDAANAVANDNSQGLLNNYNLARITPGMSYNEAIQEYVWLNRAYNDILFKISKIDKCSGMAGNTESGMTTMDIRHQLIEKKEYLMDVLNSINSCARTAFKFSPDPNIQSYPMSHDLIQVEELSKPMAIPETPAVKALLESLAFSSIEYTKALEAFDDEDDDEEEEPKKEFSMCPAELTMNMNLPEADKIRVRDRIKNGLIKAGVSADKADKLVNAAHNAANHIKLKDLTQDNPVDWQKYAARYLDYAGISPDNKPAKNVSSETKADSRKSDSKDKASIAEKAQSKFEDMKERAIDAKNKTEERREERRRQKSENKFQRETSDVSLQWKRYKKNAQDVDAKLTNSIKELTNTVFVGKNTKETRREIIEGKNYSMLALLKSILGGYMVFSVSPVAFILLLIVRKCNSKKMRRSEKKKILMELEAELQIIEEKIRDASMDGNRDAKYALMRNKANLENAINRIKLNSEMDKDSATYARDVTVNNIKA